MRVVAAVVVLLVACDDRLPNAELDRLHAEAIAANEAAKKANAESETVGFTLQIDGRVSHPGAVIGWADLQTIGTTHVVTMNPQNPSAMKPTDFEGLLVRDLLANFGAAADAEEITAVSVDGFRATVKAADAKAYRMLLAIKADGAPIPRSSGGPIFLIHPWTESPATKTLYEDRYWAFYVTNLVVGTEAPKLVVQGKALDRDAIAKIPTSAYDGPVGFKVEWPSESVHLGGMSLVDTIAAAGVALPAHGKIRVTGKSPLHHDPKQPIEFLVDDLVHCKPVLGMTIGLEEKPITARLGGPIVLAYTPCGAGYGSRHWVTFVETIDVVAP